MSESKSQHLQVTQPISCVLCGTDRDLDSALVGCGAESLWKRKNEQGQETEQRTKDDVVLWNVAICSPCLSQKFGSHLSKQVEKSFSQLGVMALLILCGSAASAWVYLRETGQFQIGPGGSNVLWSLMMTAAIMAGVVGVLGLPGRLLTVIRARTKKRLFEITHTIAGNERFQAFKEAGTHILSTIRATQKTETTESTEQSPSPAFALPVHSESPPGSTVGKSTSTYRRSSAEYCIIGAGTSTEETVVLDWAETYMRKFGREIQEKLARVCDQELSLEPRRFVPWSIVVVMALVASGIGASIGNSLAAKLLALPGSLFLGVAAFFIWLSAYDRISQFRKTFGGESRSHSRMRFVLTTVICVAAIGSAITFAASQHATYNTTKFDQWGISFMYPEDWWEVKESARDRILNEARAFQGSQKLKEFTALGIGDGKSPDAYLFVTVEEADDNQSIEDGFHARSKQLEEDQRGDDVTTIYKCEVVKIKGYPAIETDVRRSGLGRGHDVHIRVKSEWIGISLVGSDGNVASLANDFSDLLGTFEYRLR